MNAGLRSFIKKSGVYYPLLITYHHLLDNLKKIKFRVQYRSLKGKGFTCNFCGAIYSRFIDKDVPPKYQHAIIDNEVVAGYCKNCLCPNCLSTARQRLVKLGIEKCFDVPGSNILHFAPEKRIFQLLKAAQVTIVDFEPELYRHVDSKVQFADATKLQFSSNSFDYILASHILEHIPDDVQAMEEMYRILKPGGIAILQSPFSEKLINTIEDKIIHNPEQQAYLFGQEDHVRIYAFQDYVSRLQLVGFQVSVIEQSSLYNEDCLKNYALQPGEKLVLATK